MQLPRSKIKDAYINEIKSLEVALKNVTSGNKNQAPLLDIQKRLDTLAEKYQNNENIGSARYKLYELQALVHYFKGDDDDAPDFINSAIEIRGDNYARAEKLKKQLLSSAQAKETTGLNPTDFEERAKLFRGLSLAVVVIALLISAGKAWLFTIFLFVIISIWKKEHRAKPWIILFCMELILFNVGFIVGIVISLVVNYN